MKTSGGEGQREPELDHQTFVPHGQQAGSHASKLGVPLHQDYARADDVHVERLDSHLRGPGAGIMKDLRLTHPRSSMYGISTLSHMFPIYDPNVSILYMDVLGTVGGLDGVSSCTHGRVM